MKTLKNADISAGVGLCILSTAVFFYSNTYSDKGATVYGPHLFPQFLSIVLFFVSVLLIVKALQGKAMTPQDTIDRKGMFRAGGAILMCAVYIVIMQLIGFFVSTSLFLFFMMTYIKQRNILIRILASIGVAFFIMLLFENFLKIPMPGMDFTFSY